MSKEKAVVLLIKGLYEACQLAFAAQDDNIMYDAIKQLEEELLE